VVTGIPLYFTVWAENGSGGRSKAICSLLSYVITEPTGRLAADFISTSNPAVLRASVVTAGDITVILLKVVLNTINL
jgi:hypothetical protein